MFEKSAKTKNVFTVCKPILKICHPNDIKSTQLVIKKKGKVYNWPRSRKHSHEIIPSKRSYTRIIYNSRIVVKVKVCDKCIGIRKNN